MRNKFLAGLALALPLVVTFVILQFVYNMLHGWSGPIVAWFVDLANEIAGNKIVAIDHPAFQFATRVVGVLIPILALIALGVMATNVIGVHIVTAVDQLLLRVPFVSFIYKSLKQVIDSFKTIGGAQNFKRVAFIDYPVPGMRMLGFVTGGFTDPLTGKALTSVFVPTAPNPMSGILLMVDSEKVTDAGISLEDSMKLIFSGGLITPDSSGVIPLNHKPSSLPAVIPVPAEGAELAELEQEDQQTAPVESKAAAAGEFNLPRAEDFDSGDPDILATADELEDEDELDSQQAGARTSSRLARVLPWNRWR